MAKASGKQTNRQYSLSFRELCSKYFNPHTIRSFCFPLLSPSPYPIAGKLQNAHTSSGTSCVTRRPTRHTSLSSSRSTTRTMSTRMVLLRTVLQIRFSTSARARLRKTMASIMKPMRSRQRATSSDQRFPLTRMMLIEMRERMLGFRGCETPHDVMIFVQCMKRRLV